MRVSVARWGAVLAVACLGPVAGCSGDADGQPTTTSPPVSTSTTTTTPPPSSTTTGGPGSDYPEAARANTEAGGAAFVQYFFDQINVAMRTPRSGLVSSLSATSCTFCAKVESTTRELVQKQRRYSGDVTRVSNVVEIQNESTQTRRAYTFSFSQLGADLLDVTGAVVDKDTVVQGPRDIVIAWSDGRWVALGLER